MTTMGSHYQTSMFKAIGGDERKEDSWKWRGDATPEDEKYDWEESDEGMMDDWAAMCIHGKTVDIALVTLYLNVGDGVRGANERKLKGLTAFLATLRMPWIVYGDMNCEPEELQESWWIRSVDGQIVKPAGLDATCFINGKASLLDYIFCSEDAKQYIVKFAGMEGDAAPWKPHVGLELVLDLSPKQQWYRTVQRPKAFPHPHKEKKKQDPGSKAARKKRQDERDKDSKDRSKAKTEEGRKEAAKTKEVSAVVSHPPKKRTTEELRREAAREQGGSVDEATSEGPKDSVKLTEATSEGQKDSVKLTFMTKNVNTELKKVPKDLVQHSKTRARAFFGACRRRRGGRKKRRRRRAEGRGRGLHRRLRKLREGRRKGKRERWGRCRPRA